MTAEFVYVAGEGLLAEVDLSVYGLPALLKTAYRFTDRCYLHLQYNESSRVEVRFRAKAGISLTEIPGEFCNELLDQTLREMVARESEPERNLILAHALSKTTLLHPEEDAPFLETVKHADRAD
jgi:His-Xaa-Ser system protein HxsD